LEDYVLHDFNIVFVDILLNRRNISDKDDLISFPMLIGGAYKEYALLDSGASASLLSRQFIDSWNKHIHLTEEPNAVVRSFTGNKFAVKSIIVPVQTANNPSPFDHKFLVIDMDWPVICGFDLIPRCKIQIGNFPVDFPTQRLQQSGINAVDLVVNEVDDNINMRDDKLLKKFGIGVAIEANLATLKLPCSHPD